MSETDFSLPPITIVIEWENAIDVQDKWTARAMAALQRELSDVAPRMSGKPHVTYLFDENQVKPETIRKVIDEFAPKLPELAELELLPTPGLTYYRLKNFGISRATTEISIMLDSDAGPEPGWLENLLKPFADPEVMAVGGFTVLGHEDLLSRTMALSWIFNLPDERAKTERRQKIHPNNAAVRTDFFRANPFPDLPAFKKQCGVWLRDFSARGYKYVRTADAVTIHAPHPGIGFLAWRAWNSGRDNDFLARFEGGKSRTGRIAAGFRHFGRKVGKGWWRIWRRGKDVNLPVWQRPAAMLIVLGFYTTTLIGHLSSTFTRDFALSPRLQQNSRRTEATA